jgi:hypothetical protein
MRLLLRLASFLMSTKHTIFGLALLGSIGIEAGAQELPRLKSALKSNAAPELSWPATTRMEDGSVSRPFFEIDRSSDLQNWHPFGERVQASGADGEEILRVELSAEEPFSFYRVRSFPPRLSRLGADGADVLGYGEAFAKELRNIGQISVPEFAQMFPTPEDYLPGITWDPTTADFWTDGFNGNPAVINQGKPLGSEGHRTTDFRLNDHELAVFKTNGFVVADRLRTGTPDDSDSFADVFYNVWNNDLPVFVSTDAILQAWHRTYDAILEEVEETFLMSSVDRMLSQMALRLPEVWAEAQNGVLKESIEDVDYYLAVARSLLGTSQAASTLGQDQRVAETLADINALRLQMKEDFFGQCRVVDFSQFQVRGHYEHSHELSRYFRCMMWLGRIDFTVAGGPFERCPGTASHATPRETGVAIVLWDLLHRAGQFNSWLNVDRTIQTFVGWSDSLGFAQLGGLLSGAGIRSVRDVPDLAAIEKLQSDISGGTLGVQNIRSDFYVSPLGPDQVQLPRSFLFMGQRFVPDSWAFSQTVFDSIQWVENGATNKVQRRVPSALDIPFAVLANNQVVPELVARISNTNAFQSQVHAERWRDGLPYQHNLAAVRRVLDAQDPSVWESNIYMGWLAALRSLSTPTTGPAFPEAMRTRAWAMKTVNTQIASWTQLRHDTVLYAKQSYTAGYACFYPAGYVEPRTEFWKTLEKVATRAATLIETLPYEGGYTNLVAHTVIQSNQVSHLRGFADTLGKLGAISEKELAQECFDADDELFIRNLIQEVGWLPLGSGGVRKYDGWYPRLFYRGIQFYKPLYGLVSPEVNFQENYGANAADRLVTDVHTDVPSPAIQDPGGVLHQGIGSANLLMIAVDSGTNRMVFAGPVLSHYEFEIIGEPKRLTDTEWDDSLQFRIGFNGVDPTRVQGLAPPPWTSGYLVPR